jgi:hypothetical protein
VGSSTMIPMLDQNGNLGDVPQQNWQDAVTKGGFKVAVPMVDKDGNKGFIPHDQVQAAQKNGFRPDTAAPEMPTLMDTIKNSFSLDNIGKNVKQGVKELGSGVQAVLSNLGGDPRPAVGMVEGTVDQAQKAKQDFAQKDVKGVVSGSGHALAAALPGVGPFAAGFGEQAGTGDVGGALARGGTQVAASAAAGAVVKGASGVAQGIREGAPAYFKSADELAGTTPERINELKTVPQKMAAVHKLAVDTENSAKAAAKASYPDIKTPIVRTAVDDAGKVTQTNVPFGKVQEERAAIGQEISNEKRNVARGAPAYELKSLTAKYGQLSDEMRTAAQADGKLKDFQAAEVKWKQFQNDFHNPGSAVQPLLKMQPDQSSAIANHLLNNDKGARTLQTLRKYGADTSGVEKVLSRGSTPLKVDVTESSKLQKAGSDSNYRAQRFNEALDQATTNRLPSGTEAKLPAGAMKSKAPGIIDEIPGASIASPRNITRIKLKSALKTLSGEK